MYTTDRLLKQCISNALCYTPGSTWLSKKKSALKYNLLEIKLFQVKI